MQEIYKSWAVWGWFFAYEEAQHKHRHAPHDITSRGAEQLKKNIEDGTERKKIERTTGLKKWQVQIHIGRVDELTNEAKMKE